MKKKLEVSVYIYDFIKLSVSRISVLHETLHNKPVRFSQCSALQQLVNDVDKLVVFL